MVSLALLVDDFCDGFFERVQSLTQRGIFLPQLFKLFVFGGARCLDLLLLFFDCFDNHWNEGQIRNGVQARAVLLHGFREDLFNFLCKKTDLSAEGKIHLREFAALPFITNTAKLRELAQRLIDWLDALFVTLVGRIGEGSQNRDIAVEIARITARTRGNPFDGVAKP